VSRYSGGLGRREALLSAADPPTPPAPPPLPPDPSSANLRRMEPPLTRITADPRVCGGQPCVRGLRIPVAIVLRHMAAGKSAEDIVAELPELELADIPECLRYAAWLASGRTVDLPSAA
jgi:uncharacterized protein (DUF433 family)